MNIVIDAIGLVLLFTLVAVLIRGFLPTLRRSKPDFNFLKNSWITGFVAIITLILTYGMVRSQLQQSSDNSQNQMASFVVEAEYAEPLFRCLYKWDAHNQSAACLDRIASDADSYTKVMLYIEEVYWFLTSSRREANLWDSRYSDDIDFWREDVATDPTGMFSYQAVVENPENPRSALAQAGVEIAPDRLCANYRRVHAQLTLRGASPSPLMDCEGE